ncbi:MAG TPA: RraA family protein [Verrucomicrobiae bacterium]|jgi:regulator of RNase E activity RraA
MSAPEQNQPLSAATFQALAKLDACTLANAIERCHQRLRNEGFMNGSVRCLFPQQGPMLGYAATLTIRGSAPAFAGPPYADRTDWWDYIQSLPSPRVVVVQDTATHPGLASLIGEVHMNILRALECVGVVTNGAVRDIPAADKCGFHYFSANVSVSHAYVHIVKFGTPVEVAGLKIYSGDLLHGDLHGVQSIPLGIAEKLPGIAAGIAAEEQAIIDLCRAPGFSIEKLRQSVNDQKAQT